MYTKSATSGAYISSYFEAINIDVTPTNCSLFLDTGLSCELNKYLLKIVLKDFFIMGKHVYLFDKQRLKSYF